MTSPSRFIRRIAALLVGVWALGQGAAALAETPLRVVASTVPHAQILEFVQREVAPDLNLKVIEITSGIRPNDLVAAGDADANFFQHEPYLRAQKAALGQDFAVVAKVHVEPLGVYSRKISKLADVPQGATVSLPNDETNLSRGLRLLAASGLIALKPEVQASDIRLATPADVASNPHGLKFVEVGAPLLSRSLGDVTLAVINGNYALEGGLVPARDALALEQAEGNPYANILVTTPKLAADPRIQRLAQALTSPRTAAFIQSRYNGSVIPVISAKGERG